MDDKEFETLMQELGSYLEREKVFIKNPDRFAEIERAMEISAQLFSDASIAIKDDPLQMGALVVRIDCFDVTVRGETEIKLFTELISVADNFEIYPVGDERLCFALMFGNALTKLPQGKPNTHTS